MKLDYWAVMLTARGLTRLLCRIDDQSLSRVPLQGPLIIVCNHINSIEIPLVFPRLHPRQVTGFAKSETWDNPLLGPLFNIWEVIPLRRGYPDLKALKQGLRVLEMGKILAIAPEGTRSGHGRLQPGHPGVVTLAVHSGAPLLPLVYYGGESIGQNVRRLRRTDFSVRVGEPFQVQAPASMNAELRQRIADEIMFQLASLLPAQYRGVYSDLDRATREYLI